MGEELHLYEMWLDIHPALMRATPEDIMMDFILFVIAAVVAVIYIMTCVAIWHISEDIRRISITLERHLHPNQNSPLKDFGPS